MISVCGIVMLMISVCGIVVLMISVCGIVMLICVCAIGRFSEAGLLE